MVKLMGNCVPWIKGNNKKSVTILMVGLDNAGKTTAVKRVQGVSIDNVAPTVGYSTEEFKFGKFNVTIIDLGGGRKIRGIWKNYLAEVHGVIYVVDSSDIQRISESRDEFRMLLSNHLISGKPVLLFANKQDKNGALDETDISEQLNLEAVVNEFKCFCKIELCAAIVNKKDHSIKNGLTWLLAAIEKDYVSLVERVEKDVADRKVEEEQEMQAKRERVRKRREEREAEEALAAENGVTDNGAVADTTSAEPPKRLLSLKETDASLQIEPSCETSIESARSGLGSEIMDDDDDDAVISIPGSVVNSRVSLPRDDLIAETNHINKLNQIVRDSPSVPLSNNGKDDVSLTSDKGDTDAVTAKRKSKRSNKVAPIEIEHPNAPALTSLRPHGRLSPLASKNTMSLEHESNNLEPRVSSLPPLNIKKPNFDSDDDILI